MGLVWPAEEVGEGSRGTFWHFLALLEPFCTAPCTDGYGHRSQVGNLSFSVVSVHPRIPEFFGLEGTFKTIQEGLEGTFNSFHCKNQSGSCGEQGKKKEERNNTEKTKWLKIPNFQIKRFR